VSSKDMSYNAVWIELAMCMSTVRLLVEQFDPNNYSVNLTIQCR
jgi:hypothetical protein